MVSHLCYLYNGNPHTWCLSRSRYFDQISILIKMHSFVFSHIYLITKKFCTFQDSCAVLECVKFLWNWISNLKTVATNFIKFIFDRIIFSGTGAWNGSLYIEMGPWIPVLLFDLVPPLIRASPLLLMSVSELCGCGASMVISHAINNHHPNGGSWIT